MARILTKSTINLKNIYIQGVLQGNFIGSTLVKFCPPQKVALDWLTIMFGPSGCI